MHYFRYLIFFVLIFSPIHASDNQLLRVAIVFDASGSMWERVGNSTKIEIAKGVLKNVITHWNTKIPLGLTIYGHRKKGDCNDIEMAIPVAKLNQEKMLNIIKNIKPKGKTPISRSLKITAQKLDYLKHQVTLILISDGKETCDDSPLKTIKELKAKGKKLNIHVIGFNVNKDATTQLKSIAEITGGIYLPAKDIATLNKAFKTITTKIQKSKPIVVPKNNLLISASEIKNGKWVKALHILYSLEADKNKTKQKSCLSYIYTPCKLKVPAGKYFIHSSYNLYNKTTEVAVEENNISRVNVVMGRVGKLYITAREKKGGSLIAIENVTILGENNKTVIVTHTLKTKAFIEKLPVGKYYIQYEYHGYRGTLPVQINSKKVNKIDIITGKTGRVSVTASKVKGGKYITAFHTFYRRKKGRDNIEKNITASCYSEKEKPCSVQIPVGDYIIESNYKDLNLKTDIKVIYQKNIQKHIIMKPTGKVEIVARESKKSKLISVSYTILKNNTLDKNQTTPIGGKTNIQKPITVELFAGKYSIDVTYYTYKKHFSFEVKANSTKHIELIMGKTGYSTLSAVLEKNGKAVDASYTLYEEKNETRNIIDAICQKRENSNCTFQLPIGDYIAEASFAPFVRTKKFHIDEGKKSYVQFVMNPSGSIQITADEKNGRKGVHANHSVYRLINHEINQSDSIAMCYSERKHPCNIKLLIGKYLLISKYNHFERKTPFEVKEDKVLPLHIKMGQTGEVNITAYDTPKGTPLVAYHYIYKANSNSKKSITDCGLSKHCIRRLPVGEYIVKSEYDILEKRKHFSIKNDRMTHLDIILGKVIPVRIQVTVLPSGEKVMADQEIYRIDTNNQLQEIVKMCWYKEKEQSCTVTLPEGNYILKTKYKGVKKETNFKVKNIDKNIVNVLVEKKR